MNPGMWVVGRALDAVRRFDEAAEKGWQDCLQNRLRGAQAMVAWSKEEGSLRPELDVGCAADLL
jgi:hypothetical protein